MEYCNDHSEMVKAVGRMEGRQISIESTVNSMDDKLNKLVSNGIRKDAIEVTQRNERRWIHWVWVSAGGAAILIVVQTLFPKFLKALAELLK